MGFSMKTNIISLIICVISLFALPVAQAKTMDKTCDTHEACTVGNTCQCTIIPSSAYNRYFYFDISGIEKGHTYQCYFIGSPSLLSVVMDASKFPEGVEVKCLGACPQFPTELYLDTTKMVAQTGAASVKYFVPASDIPDRVKVECQIVSLSGKHK
jgi:hypothetical protein